MRIFCNGCSWTWGDELKEPLESRYSTLLGQMFGAEVINIALGGTSLHRLMRSTYEQCDPTKYDLAVLQFTYPSRTEYYIDGRHKNREMSFMRVLSYVTTVSSMPQWKDLKRADDHIKYQQSYYKTAYSSEMFHTSEYMSFQAMQDYFARHNVPLVTLTLNQDSILPFDLNINTSDIPRAERTHPNELGHRVIAKKLEPIIKQRLSNVSYVDAKKVHLNRLKREHEEIHKPNCHTDYN